MSDTEMLDTQDEVFDFSNDGFQPGEHKLLVTEVEIVEKEKGRQMVVVVESETLQFPVSIREWVSHTTPKAQEIGRGNIKRLFKAALGSDKGSPTELVGKYISGRVYEDDAGFIRVNRLKGVTE